MPEFGRRALCLLGLALAAAAPFDQHKIVFSPKGELLQLDYAAEAVANAPPVAAIKVGDAILLAALKTAPTGHAKLRDFSGLEKLMLADTHVAVGACGLKPDALLLRQLTRDLCAEHRRLFEEPMPIHLLASRVADLMHEFTQGLNRGRPLGTALVLAGWDAHYGLQIYKVDSTGAVSSWRGVCMGLGASQVEAELEALLPGPAPSDVGLAEPDSKPKPSPSPSLSAARGRLLEALGDAVGQKGYQRYEPTRSPSGDTGSLKFVFVTETMTIRPPPQEDAREDELLVASPGARPGERVAIETEANMEAAAAAAAAAASA